MKQAKANPRKTQRLNLCITREDREALEEIAEREDRELGYLAGWFLQWGIRQYRSAGASLVTLKNTKIARDKQMKKQAEQRLVLREEAQREHEQLSGSSPERKRA
jgi:hypothetical protein